MAAKKTLNLPEQRYEQFTYLAEALGLTHSAALGEALKALRKDYELEHVLPGVSVKRIDAADGAAIALKLGDLPIRTLTLEGARALAKAIRDYAADKSPRKAHLLDMDHNFEVKGVKRSTAIFTEVGGTPWQTTPDLALEVAELLETKAS